MVKGIDLPAKIFIKKNNANEVVVQGINLIEGANTGLTLNLVDDVLHITSSVVVPGAASTIMDSNITPNKALISDSLGKVAVDPLIDKTELERLDNITSNIQDQINAKITKSTSHIFGRNTATLTDIITRFARPDLESYHTQEDNAKIIIGTACTVTKLVIKANTNTQLGTSTITLRKNGVDTALSVTFATLETGIKTSTGSVAISVNDEINYSIVTNGLGVFGNLSAYLAYTIP